MTTARQSPERQFAWLWSAYTISTFGTCLAFEAFPLIAIMVLHAGPEKVALLKAAGLAIAACVAAPIGPWVEYRRKQPVMVTMDLIRFATMLTVPVAFVLGWLGFVQLVTVAVISGAADITFRAASGAFLKTLVPSEKLLRANARFESTMWTAISLGPPLGGLAIGGGGPVVTIAIDAISYLLSAWGIRAIETKEPLPAHSIEKRFRFSELLEGWRYILKHPSLRPLFMNTVLVNSLIMATSPLMAVLMLGQLGFAPWQYGLAFGAPCIGGLIGSRLAPALVTRFGERQVMLISGTLRACWSIGLAFIGPGNMGIACIIAIQLGLVTCVGVFNPLFVTYRLAQTEGKLIARTLCAWQVTNNAAIAALTALWGILASTTSIRTAIVIAGVLLLASPILLPRRKFSAQMATPDCLPGENQ